MSKLNQLIQEKRIFLIGGPGGVGKTTTAASLSVSCALQGYKTIVLTVDPAKRLAQALGFKNGFDRELQQVSLPDGTKGTLTASMLDTAHYFDRVIGRFAASEAQRDRILNNPLYRTIVEGLGGTHEYAAMERLLDFVSNPEYEKIIVDTPPSQNAMDLLSAPERMAEFMDSSVLSWFQSSRPLMSVFRTGTKLAMKLLHKIFGSDFMDKLASFFDDIQGMHTGFKERNLRVIECLQSPQSAFFLVNIPQENRIREALAFAQVLKTKRIQLEAMIFNQVEPVPPKSLNASPQLQEMLAYFQKLSDIHEHWIGVWRRESLDTLIVKISRKKAPPDSLFDLIGLGNELLSH